MTEDSDAWASVKDARLTTFLQGNSVQTHCRRNLYNQGISVEEYGRDHRVILRVY